MILNKISRSLPYICVFVLTLTSACDYPAAETKKFDEEIQAHLKQVGDMVNVADIIEGDWTQICYLPEYERASWAAAAMLKIPRDQAKIRNNDYVFGPGFIFLYPPDSAEYYEIADFKFKYAGGESCVLREQAVLELMRLRPDFPPGIQLKARSFTNNDK